MSRAKFANIRPGYVAPTPKPYKNAVPLEHEEAKKFAQWLDAQGILRMFAVPNGGHRSKASAGKAKAEGQRPGVPDYILPLRIGDCPGLVIELKRVKGGRVSPEQRDWLDWFWSQGWGAEVCHGADAAISVVKAYLAKQPKPAQETI